MTEEQLWMRRTIVGRSAVGFAPALDLTEASGPVLRREWQRTAERRFCATDGVQEALRRLENKPDRRPYNIDYRPLEEPITNIAVLPLAFIGNRETDRAPGRRRGRRIMISVSQEIEFLGCAAESSNFVSRDRSETDEGSAYLRRNIRRDHGTEEL
jgi:hypothetical protein